MSNIETPKTLSDLCDAITEQAIELTDELDDFGGEEPDCTVGVWSWDDTHVLVGTHAGDVEIVSREQHEAEALMEKGAAQYDDWLLAGRAGLR